MKCDFCSTQPVVAVYPARDFETHVASHLRVPGRADGVGSEGEWAVCVACDRLVQRTDRDALLHRSLKKLMKKLNAPRSAKGELRREVRKLHDDFWRNRDGERREVRT